MLSAVPCVWRIHIPGVVGMKCEHADVRRGTIYSREHGVAFKTDCGDRRSCPAARKRWSRGMRDRFELVQYFRTPDLWTFTARTQEQDALRLARRKVQLGQGESYEGWAPYFMWQAQDRGVINRENLKIFNDALENVVQAVRRQSERESQPGYHQTRHAAMLRRKYGTHHVARGRPGAALRLRVREAGELHGRLHAHAASDFDYLDKRWLQDVCFRCGLGYCQYERKETRTLRSAARFSGPRVRASTIAHYLSKYLTTADDAPWPWPRHARLVSAARKVLPLRQSKPGWCFTWQSVARVAVEQLGAVEVDAEVDSYSAPADPQNRVHAPPLAA